MDAADEDTKTVTSGCEVEARSSVSRLYMELRAGCQVPAPGRRL